MPSEFWRLGLDASGMRRAKREAEGHFRDIDKASGKADKGVDRSMKSMTRAVKAFASSLAGLGIIRVGKSFATATLEIQGMTAAMKVATGSADAAAVELGFVRDISDRLGLSMLDSAKAFTKLSASASIMEFTAGETRDIFEGVATASRAMRLSTEQTRGALTAIEQVMSKGKVQAEELRGQLGERIPGAFGLAAKAIGVTTAELDKLLETGDVTARDLLIPLGKVLREQFGEAAAEAAELADASFERFKNSLFELKAVAGDELLPVLGDIAKQLNEYAKSDEARELFRDLGGIFRDVANLVGERVIPAIQALVSDTGRLKDIIVALIALKFSAWLLGARSRLLELAAATVGAEGAMKLAHVGATRLATALGTAGLAGVIGTLIALGFRGWIRGWREEMERAIDASTQTARDIPSILDSIAGARRNMDLAAQSDVRLIEDKDVDSIRKARQELLELAKSYTAQAGATGLSLDEVQAWNDNALTATLQADRLTRRLIEIGDSFKVVKSTGEEATGSVDEVTGASEEAEEAAKKLAKSWNDLLNELNPSRAALDKYKAGLALVETAMNLGIGTADDYREALEKLREEFDEATRIIEPPDFEVDILPTPDPEPIEKWKQEAEEIRDLADEIDEAFGIPDGPGLVGKIEGAVGVSQEWIRSLLQVVDALGLADTKLGDIIQSVAGILSGLDAVKKAGKGFSVEGVLAGAQTGASVAALSQDLGFSEGPQKTTGFGGKTEGDFSQELAAIGGAIGSIWGPVGALAGSVIGDVVGSFMKKGADEALGKITLAGDEMVSEIKKVEGGLGESIEALTVGIGDTINSLFDSIGAEIASVADIETKIRGDEVVVFFENTRKVFESIEEATEWITLQVAETAQLKEGLDTALQQALQAGTAGSVEELQHNLGVVQGLINVERMAVQGLSEIEIALEGVIPQFHRTEQSLLDMGLAADQAARLAGGQLVASLQAFRQSITGEQLSPEEQLQIKRQQGELFNATRDLAIAEFELKKSNLEAEAGIAQAGLTLDREVLKGKAESVRIEAGIGQSRIDLQGQVFSGELSVMRQFGQGAGVVLGATADLIQRQLEAINRVLESLRAIPEIDIAAIKLNNSLGNVGKSMGGAAKAINDNLRVGRSGRRDRRSRALDEINRLLEPSGAQTFADRLAEINEQFSEAAKLDQKFGFGKLAELQTKYLETVQGAIEQQIDPVQRLLDDLTLDSTSRRGAAAAFGQAQSRFSSLLAQFNAGDLGSAGDLADIGRRLADLASEQFGGTRLEFFLASLRSQLKGALGQDFAQTFVEENPLLPLAQEQNNIQKEIKEEIKKTNSEVKKTNEKLANVEQAQKSTSASVSQMQNATTQILGKSETIQKEQAASLNRLNDRLDEFLRKVAI